MRVVELPKPERQIRRIVKDPDGYVKETRKRKRRRAERQRALVINRSRGRIKVTF